MREPFVDSVPCLRSLLEYLSEHSFEIELISTTDSSYRAPSFNPKVHFTDVGMKRNARDRSVGIPATVKLVFAAFEKACREVPRVFLGAGTRGFIASGILSKMFRVPSVSFCVELPTMKTDKRQKKLLELLEKYFLKRSAMIITQDQAHSSFIAREIGVPIERIFALPNSMRGKICNSKQRVFHDKFGLQPNMTVVLHSGGLGPWFESLELARAALSWPTSWCLIFHTRQRVDGEPYGNAVFQVADNAQIFFSIEPVSAQELDGLVSSAQIGVALYSVETLGYRAELMGLASGKIGNYLKCGLPVVATDLPTIRPYIEEYGCGICVKHAEEIKDAIATILQDYETYRNNAFRCFKELWEPERYLANIVSKVSKL